MSAAFRAFVGRESEIALLRHALRKAVAGQGTLFMISGAHGVGKSSLVKRLARDAHLLDVPYIFANEQLATGFNTTIAGTISDVIRTSGKDLLLRWNSNSPHDIQQRGIVFEQMRIEQPTLLILEDIHVWSTQALASLRFLERVIDEAGVLAVATYCEGEIRRDLLKRPLFRDLIHFAIDMTLGDLDESASCELVEALANCRLEPSVGRAIFRATGGSPMLIECVLQACSNPRSFRVDDRFFAQLSISLPTRDVLMSCLSELSPSSREVLNAAAVLGNEFALDVLASICALEGRRELLNSLDEAREAGLLEQDGEHEGRYRFRRSLMRQLLYADLSSFRRAELHLRAADAIEALHGVTFNAAGEIVKHLREGSHENGSNAAGSNGSREDATVQQTKTRVDFLVRLGKSEACAGLYEAALRTLSRAGAAAERLGDTVRLARIALAMPSQLVPLPGAQNPAAALLARSALSRDHALGTGLRAELSARLAAEISYVPEASDRAHRLMAEALEAANGCDAEVQLHVLTYRDLLLRGPEALDQRADNACAIDELAARVGDRAASHFGFVARATAHLERGEISLAEFAWSEATTAAGFAPGPGELVSISLSRASEAFVEGRLEEARTILQELREDDGADARCDIGEAMRALVCREQGAFPDAHDAARKTVARHPSCRIYRAVLALIDLDLGGQRDARAHFERLSGDRYRHLPSDGLFLACGALLAELCAELGDLKRAEVLYSLLVPHGSHFAVMGHGLVLGPISLHLGILAISLGRFEAARLHLEEALAMNCSAGVRPWTGYANYHLARCLARAGGSLGAIRVGQAALEETLAEAEALGMIRLLERARLLRDTVVTPDAELSTEAQVPKGDKAPQEAKGMAIASDDGTAEAVQFCEEDETYVLGFSGRKVRLRRSKGLELMLMLVREPGREFHVVDLGRANPRSGHGGEGGQPTDGGPLLDASAKQSYRLRLQDLREEREEAQKFNDFQRVSRIEEEISFLARELARAIGLKGADRKALSDTERARVRVTHAIRSTIRKISEHDSVLGWYLENSIKTGSFCCYRPAPSPAPQLTP